jgi:hypothetical protein
VQFDCREIFPWSVHLPTVYSQLSFISYLQIVFFLYLVFLSYLFDFFVLLVFLSTIILSVFSLRAPYINIVPLCRYRRQAVTSLVTSSMVSTFTPSTSKRTYLIFISPKDLFVEFKKFSRHYITIFIYLNQREKSTSVVFT